MAANIVLADATTPTPVNRTFVPTGPDSNGVFWFEDQSASSAIGFWRISVQLKRPPVPKARDNSSTRTFRVEIGLHEPILEVLSNSTVSGIAPAPTVSYVPRCFIQYVLPERTVAMDRKNMRKMSADLLDNAQIIACVENLVSII